MITELASLLDRSTTKLTGGNERPGEPPLVRGTIPYLGVAVEFGRHAGELLSACQREHGDVFTLLLAGERMTFVLDPHAYPTVLKLQKELTFDGIAFELSATAFGHTRAWEQVLDIGVFREFYGQHLKGAALGGLAERMQHKLDATAPPGGERGWRRGKLCDFVARWMFDAGMDTLFGDGAASDRALEDFRVYDRAFPLLVAGVPVRLLRGVGAARDRLAAVFGEDRTNESELMQARTRYMRGRVSEHDRHRMQLSILWASQANTVPAAFWSLAFLLHDPEAKAAVIEEIRAVAGDGPIGAEHLKKLRRLESAMQEALRLSSASLTMRRVERDMSLTLGDGRSHRLREGDRVCLYPYVTHRDPELYPEPTRYLYDRFLAADGSPRQFFKGKKRVTIPLMPYGGGVSMCPGRFLANSEVMQFVATALTRFDFELEGELPALDQTRAGLGILPPVDDVDVSYRRRQCPSFTQS